MIMGHNKGSRFDVRQIMYFIEANAKCSIFSYFPTNHVTVWRPLRKRQYNPIIVSSLSLLYGPKSYCIGICHWFKSLILKMGRISFGYSVHFDISFKQFLDGNISNLHIQLVIDFPIWNIISLHYSDTIFDFPT